MSAFVEQADIEFHRWATQTADAVAKWSDEHPDVVLQTVTTEQWFRDLYEEGATPAEVVEELEEGYRECMQ